MTTTDLAAAAERINKPWASYHSPQAAHDYKLIAREYLRLLPYIQAVRDRRAELVAANDGIDIDAVGAALDWHRLAAYDLAGAVCGEVTTPIAGPRTP